MLTLLNDHAIFFIQTRIYKYKHKWGGFKKKKRRFTMRRYLAMALIAMGFSLAGCGIQQESSNTSATAADTQNAVTQEAAAQGEDAEAQSQWGSG